ncbi:uncharacterized protein Tsen15 [Drosophila montana]|uniref:uncharacterized protein Tsen15 n=1 Tax=Drosophila montana TaxID=40370 RepID=UPI00313D402E
MDLDTICPDLNGLTRALAQIVHKDLTNDERLSNIQPKLERDTGEFYWSAQNKEHQQMMAYIPTQHSKDLDFELIKVLQQKLLNCIIIVAIVDTTGNILYYQMTEGFKEK